MNYLITELDGTKHEFDFENIADMQVCTTTIQKLKDVLRIPGIRDHNGRILKEHIPRIKKEMFDIVCNLPNIECLPETIEKIDKVSIPITDY